METLWNNSKLRGTIWAADTYQCSWTLKEAISQQPEHSSTAKPSQTDSENSSESETELEEESLVPMELGHFHTHFPSPFQLWKPYLCNQHFKDTNGALEYITENFCLYNLPVPSHPIDPLSAGQCSFYLHTKIWSSLEPVNNCKLFFELLYSSQ